MEAFQKLLSQYTTRRFTAGEMVLYQGEVPEAVFVVKSGYVKMYNISSDGDEKPISFHGKNDILSSSWVFGKAQSALFFYEAHTACELYAVPRSEFRQALAAEPALQAYMLDRYVSANTAKALRLYGLQYSRAADKLLHMMFYLSQIHGRTLPDGNVLIEIPLTQQDLANFLGLTRETTGMELLKIKKRGLITQSKRHYRIDIKRLQETIGETDFDSSAL